MSANPTSPAELFGGTWEAFGTGRTIVGVDTNQTEFDNVEETGGSKNHSHTLNNGYAKLSIWGSDNNKIAYSEKAGVSQWTTDYGAYTSNAGNMSKTSDYGINLGGSTDNGSNMMPYITVYMWKRVS